jgi:uncharacterized protein YcbX
MVIQGIWRYPVKSMAGELLKTADITEHGISGDRIIQVRSASGRIFSRTDPPVMSTFSTAVFLGVDLGWCGKPSGLASIAINREGLSLRNVTRLEDTDDILRWIKSEAGSGTQLWGWTLP